jgi:hypothetical protein
MRGFRLRVKAQDPEERRARLYERYGDVLDDLPSELAEQLVREGQISLDSDTWGSLERCDQDLLVFMPERIDDDDHDWRWEAPA